MTCALTIRTSVHTVPTSLVFDSVPSDHLPDCGPQWNLKCCDTRRLTSLISVEKACTKEPYKILLARILWVLSYIKVFEWSCSHTFARSISRRDEHAIRCHSVTCSHERWDIDALDQLETWLHKKTLKVPFVLFPPKIMPLPDQTNHMHMYHQFHMLTIPWLASKSTVLENNSLESD